MTCNRRRLASSHTDFATPCALKDHDGPFRNFAQLFDEDGALVAQRIHDVTAMDNFMADVDRRSVLFQREIDDIDRPVDPGAKAAWIGEIDLHDRPFLARDIHSPYVSS